MRTLADVINSNNKIAEINLEDCVIVKEHKNNKFNVVCKLDGKKIYVNYIDLELCKDNKLTIKYGKKEENWSKPYWYQIDPEELAETKEEK